MSNFGFDVNTKLKKRLFFCYASLCVAYLFMTISTTITYKIIKNTHPAYLEMIFSSLVANTYTVLFFVGFCIFLHAIYRRFEVINECIR